MGEDSEPTGWWRLRPERRFPLTLLLLLSAVGALFQLGIEFVAPIQRQLSLATAWVIDVLLGSYGNESFRHGDTLTFQGFSVRIIGECTGMVEFALLAAFMLAFPARWKEKLRGIVLGGLGIDLFNLIRIVGLLVLGAKAPEYFSFFHIYFWQVTAIGMISAIFLVWTRSLEARVV